MGQTATIGEHKTSVYSRSRDGREYTCVKYHATEVVIFSSKAILLDSGGWKSATTKVRMNQASRQYNLGFQVFQKNYEWFVDFRGKVIEFTDGMVLTR